MEKTATLNLRVNPEVKERAEKVLAQLGVPMSTAINMYLNKFLLQGEFRFLFLYRKHQHLFMRIP